MRAPKREGLIRARLIGSDNALGDVLVFLDSHCECTEGWLEPLIDPIARNSNFSTFPIVESISDKTFEFEKHETTNIHERILLMNIQTGGFDWELLFTWNIIPQYEVLRRASRILPIRSVRTLLYL